MTRRRGPRRFRRFAIRAAGRDRGTRRQVSALSPSERPTFGIRIPRTDARAMFRLVSGTGPRAARRTRARAMPSNDGISRETSPPVSRMRMHGMVQAKVQAATPAGITEKDSDNDRCVRRVGSVQMARGYVRSRAQGLRASPRVGLPERCVMRWCSGARSEHVPVRMPLRAGAIDERCERVDERRAAGVERPAARRSNRASVAAVQQCPLSSHPNVPPT
jgi:hypothetical protein